jgi:hypothetical protein
MNKEYIIINFAKIYNYTIEFNSITYGNTYPYIFSVINGNELVSEIITKKSSYKNRPRIQWIKNI